MGSHDIRKSERVIFGGRSGHNLGGHHSCLAFLFLFASRIVFQNTMFGIILLSLCAFVSHGISWTLDQSKEYDPIVINCYLSKLP